VGIIFLDRLHKAVEYFLLSAYPINPVVVLFFGNMFVIYVGNKRMDIRSASP
jgi:hypothetical protein